MIGRARALGVSNPLTLTLCALLDLVGVSAIWTLGILSDGRGRPLLDLGGWDGFLVLSAGLFGIGWVFRLFVTDVQPATWYFSLLSLVLFLLCVFALYALHPYDLKESPQNLPLALTCAAVSASIVLTIGHLASPGARRRFDLDGAQGQ